MYTSIIPPGSVILPKTLKCENVADIMRNLHHYYRLNDKGVGENKTSKVFHQVFSMICDPTYWKNPFMCYCAPEYKNVVIAAIIFYLGDDPVISDQCIISHGYQAW